MPESSRSDHAIHEVTSGLRGLLSVAPLFNLFTRAVARDRVYHDFIQTHVDPGPGRSLLDCGCGTGRLLEHLGPSVQYTGFDLSDAYIRQARQQHGDRGCFITAGVTDPDLTFEAPFDAILCGGLIHHLPDDVVTDLLTRAAGWLGDDGRLITYDTCILPDSGRIARWFMNRDRGQHVRSLDAYRELARSVFTEVHAFEIRNLNRIPYDILAMICQRPRLTVDAG
jgi:cyclopropane fatty-acyl-phospholipid synthase-like methyltransferase